MFHPPAPATTGWCVILLFAPSLPIPFFLFPWLERLVRYEPSPFLRLDARALAALQLVPTASNGSAPSRAPGSPATSLLSYLNRCKTSLGSRLLRRWLCRPLVDEEAISRRHAIVEVRHFVLYIGSGEINIIRCSAVYQFFYKQTLTRQKLRETHLR